MHTRVPRPAGRMCWSSFPAPRAPSGLGPPPPRPGLRFAWPG